MTSPGNSANPRKYHLLMTAIRIAALLCIVLGVLIALFGVIAVVGTLIDNEANNWFVSIGLAALILLAGLLLGGLLWKLGFWIRRRADRYRPLFNDALANLPPVQSPPSSIVAAAKEQIHFSSGYSNWGKEAEQGGGFDWTLLFYAGYAVVILCVYAIHRAFQLPTYVFLGVIAPLCLLPALWQAIDGYSRRRRIRNSRDKLAASPDNQFRLRCIGIPEEFEDLGGFVDVSFEPAVFNVSWTSIAALNPITRKAAWITWCATGLITAAIAFMLGAPLTLYIWLCGGMMAAATCIVMYLGWQTYLEVSPGRLDIYWISMFGCGRKRGFSVDLRTARVLVDTRRWQIRLDSSTSEKSYLILTILLIPGRMELAYRILLAAISSHESPRGPAKAEDTPD